MSNDLFANAAEQRLAAQAPLAARLRPQKLDDVVGQKHLLAPGAPLRSLIEADRVTSLIIWGPPGVGKTTLARLIAAATERYFVAMSAVTAGVKDVREAVEGAKQRLGERGERTILFLDEVHRFNKTQQDALLPSVEDGLLTLIGATTENPFFEVNAPLLSRSTLFRLEPLSIEDLSELAERGLKAERATIDDDALELLTDLVEGDARALLTTLEVAVAVAGEDRHVTLDNVEAARQTRALRYGEDEHYDIISAFIKSIRGSDPDAALYWMARMLAAGEDARFVARRLVVLASEDVGMADPTGLLIANAAAHAVEFVGLPEARINLAHAVVYLSMAPKSNRAYMAYNAAEADVRDRPAGAVPPHLRDGSYKGARTLGHGQGYQYPHDAPEGWVAQQYRPADLEGRRYYEPTDRGRERAFTDRQREADSPATEERNQT